MMAHFWEESTGDKVQVSRGFTELKPCNYTATACQTAHHFRETIPATSRKKGAEIASAPIACAG